LAEILEKDFAMLKCVLIVIINSRVPAEMLLRFEVALDWHMVWDAAVSHRRSDLPVAQTAQSLHESQWTALWTLTV